MKSVSHTSQPHNLAGYRCQIARNKTNGASGTPVSGKKSLKRRAEFVYTPFVSKFKLSPESPRGLSLKSFLAIAP
jgi:hypothetical protein